ncbi:MAG: hypothetical protein JWL96_1042 [Sphingomonas bacterium]|nr:hypothetical protein [Sphingomonas bacterium]
MRLMAGLVFLAASTSAAPVLAQAAPAAPPAAQAPSLAAGATIYDPAGGVVGTIDSIVGDIVVVSTGTNKVSLAKNVFGAGPKGPIISMTKVQLDAAAAQAASSAATTLKAKLVSGAQVHGASGTVVGTVKAVVGQFVDLDTPKGAVRLPITAFTVGTTGDIIIGMTAEQFDAAVAAAK